MLRMNSICRVAGSFDTTYHMYDTELQSKTRSTRNRALRMDGIEAILSKQKAAALMFDNSSLQDCITAWRAI